MVQSGLRLTTQCRVTNFSSSCLHFPIWDCGHEPPRLVFAEGQGRGCRQAPELCACACACMQADTYMGYFCSPSLLVPRLQEQNSLLECVKRLSRDGVIQLLGKSVKLFWSQPSDSCVRLEGYFFWVCFMTPCYRNRIQPAEYPSVPYGGRVFWNAEWVLFPNGGFSTYLWLTLIPGLSLLFKSHCTVSLTLLYG